MDIFEIINWITLIVTAASAIAATTPTPKDDAFIGKAYKFLDALALNVMKAKDKAPEPPSTDKA